MASAVAPFAVDLPPTSVARGKEMATKMGISPPKLNGIQQKRFARRASMSKFYGDTDKLATIKLPRAAPVPGYTGFFVGMNCDYGVSKAFGLPMEIMQIPKTPDYDDDGDGESALQSGYGPNGRHRMGQVSLFAGKGYAERTQMMEHFRRCRITGDGKAAPFDFVPGDGLVQECHIHTDSVFHQYPHTEAKVGYMPDNNRRNLRRPKGSPEKGFAPPRPMVKGVPGTTKYSIFNLPTLSQVTTRKTQVTRV